MKAFKEKLNQLRGTYFSFKIEPTDYNTVKKQLEEEGFVSDEKWNSVIGEVVLEQNEEVYIIVAGSYDTKVFSIHNHAGLDQIEVTFNYNELK